MNPKWFSKKEKNKKKANMSRQNQRKKRSQHVSNRE